MEVYIFGRFHARGDHAAALTAALRAVLAPTRAEPGCLAINAFRSLRYPSLFYAHSLWIDEAAFDLHAETAADLRFRAAGRAAHRPSIRGGADDNARRR